MLNRLWADSVAWTTRDAAGPPTAGGEPARVATRRGAGSGVDTIYAHRTTI